MIDDIKRLLKHSSIYSLGNVAMRAGAFILLPLYTRYLTVAEYGILELLYSILSVVSTFLSVGLAHATLRFYFEYDDKKDRNAVISTSLMTSFLITVPSVFLLSFLSSKISRLVFDSTEYVLALYIVYITIVFEMARQVGLAYMRAREYSVLFVCVSITQLIIQVGCNVYAVAFLELGVNGILIGNMISVFFGLMICSYVAIKECGIRYDLSKMKEMFKYSYPFLFSSMSGVVCKNADRFILKTFLSMEAVGIYGLALKFGMLLQELIIEPFQRSFGAFRFSIMKQANARDIQARTLNYIVFIVGWTGLGISLFGSDIIRFLTTSAYIGVGNFIPLVVFAHIIGSSAYVFQTGILYTKKTLRLFYINAISGITGVGVSFICIKMFGIYGACFGLIYQFLINTLLTIYVSQRLYKVSYTYGKVFLAFFIVLLIYGASLFLALENIIFVMGLKGLCLAIFPFVLIKFDYFTPDELELVVKYWQKIKPGKIKKVSY
jgi:O-antigen/teichoic acid export membrane protein